jgi:hypothetical protein
MKYKLSGDDVGSGLALIARIRGVIGAIALLVAVVLMIMVGIKAIRDKHTLAVQGTVAEVILVKQVGNQSSCTVRLIYEVNSKPYDHITTIFVPVPPKVDDKITVYVDPQNPDDLQLVEVSPRTGWALIGGAIVLSILFAINLYFLFTSKGYAEVVGGVEVVRSVI